VYVGSAVALAFLAALFTSSVSEARHQYGYVQVDARQCVADTSSDVLVTTDAVPACVPSAGRTVVAAR
jgi:hypothetical protein